MKQKITNFQKQVYPVRKNGRKFNKKEISEFSNGVYKITKRIPSGEVMSYKAVAKAIGRPKAYRAVGNTLNKNTNPEVSCHRVIRSDGKVGGYRLGTKRKIFILKKEGVRINKSGKYNHD